MAEEKFLNVKNRNLLDGTGFSMRGLCEAHDDFMDLAKEDPMKILMSPQQYAAYQLHLDPDIELHPHLKKLPLMFRGILCEADGEGRVIHWIKPKTEKEFVHLEGKMYEGKDVSLIGCWPDGYPKGFFWQYNKESREDDPDSGKYLAIEKVRAAISHFETYAKFPDEAAPAE